MRRRRKATIAAAAVFALGAAFAAEPTSVRADWGEGALERALPWSPGTNSLMSAHEPNQELLAPPR